jgi:hypothetical protein
VRTALAMVDQFCATGSCSPLAMSVTPAFVRNRA